MVLLLSTALFLIPGFRDQVKMKIMTWLDILSNGGLKDIFRPTFVIINMFEGLKKTLD